MCVWRLYGGCELICRSDWNVVDRGVLVRWMRRFACECLVSCGSSIPYGYLFVVLMFEVFLVVILFVAPRTVLGCTASNSRGAGCRGWCQ